MKRIAWLDGARAYAIAGVVLVHAASINPNLDNILKHISSFGQYGVQLFFIISAITVFITLPNEGEFRDRASWLIRRFFRIAPLYYLAIAAYAVLDLLKLKLGADIQPERFAPMTIFSNVLFFHSIYAPGNNTVVPGGWSIGVEMIFYVIAAIALPWIRRSKYSTSVVIILITSSLIISGITFRTVSNNSFGYLWIFTQIPVIFIGTILCLNVDMFERPANPRAGALLLAFGITGGAICGPIMGVSHLFAPTLFGIGFCGLLLLASSAWRRAFDNPVAVWMGSISFSIYIVHFAIRDALIFADLKLGLSKMLPPAIYLVLTFSTILATSCIVATLTKRYVEDPGIALGRRLAKRLRNAPVEATT